MPQTTMYLIGNLVDDPDLRFTPSGAAVANFRVASTPRQFNKATGEWGDGETVYMTCSVWREQAENAAESLRRGDRVVVVGKLKSRTFETREGGNRTVLELDVEEVGPSLRYAEANVTKKTRSNHGRSDSQPRSRPQPRHDDPWASVPAPSSDGHDPWAPRSGSQLDSSHSDEPPF